ncbi:MAG: hypothetical protein EHM27_08130 [Deltaproteobacteria bacterium]|nr:MAG: hypothetical protein EHM27_08130 [Deltaproteobacteria bacterium]
MRGNDEVEAQRRRWVFTKPSKLSVQGRWPPLLRAGNQGLDEFQDKKENTGNNLPKPEEKNFGKKAPPMIE